MYRKTPSLGNLIFDAHHFAQSRSFRNSNQKFRTNGPPSSKRSTNGSEPFNLSTRDAMYNVTNALSSSAPPLYVFLSMNANRTSSTRS